MGLVRVQVARRVGFDDDQYNEQHRALVAAGTQALDGIEFDGAASDSETGRASGMAAWARVMSAPGIDWPVPEAGRMDLLPPSSSSPMRAVCVITHVAGRDAVTPIVIMWRLGQPTACISR